MKILVCLHNSNTFFFHFSFTLLQQQQQKTKRKMTSYPISTKYLISSVQESKPLAPKSPIELNSNRYFATCALGGILACGYIYIYIDIFCIVLATLLY